MAEIERDKRGRRKRPPTSNPPSNVDKFFGNADRLAAFFEAVEVFGDITDACQMVGVSRTVVYDERDRNPEFAARLRKAQLQIEFDAVSDVRKGKRDKNWRRAAWLAEKKNSRRWGRKDPQAVTPEMIVAVSNRISNLLIAFVPVEKLAEASAALATVLSDFAAPFKANETENDDEERRSDG